MATTLQDLERRWKKHDTTKLATRLPVNDVKPLPEVFQPRFEADPDEPLTTRDRKAGIVIKSHVATLATHLKDVRKELDPILVLKIGKANLLIDGHHRLAAYRLKGRQEIPVVWFPEGPAQAVIAAGAINFKDVAQSGQITKTQRAWDMVRGDYPWTRPQIMAATTVSEATVASMKRVKKKFADKQEQPPIQWREAYRASKPKSDEEGTGKGPSKHEQTIAKWVKTLKDEFPKLATLGQAHMFALALMEFSPRRSADIAVILVREMGLYDRIETTHEQLLEDLEHAYDLDMEGPVEKEF
jgi:hypothetical protein